MHSERGLRKFYLHVKIVKVASAEDFLKVWHKFLKSTKPNQKKLEMTEEKVQGMVEEA